MIYYILNIIALGLCIWLIYKWVSPSLRIEFFTLAVVLKLLGGCMLGLVYMNYYGGVGDTLTYHRTAEILANTARTNWLMFVDIFLFNPLPEYQQQPRAWVMVQLVTVFHIVTNNNYWITSCWFSLFAFAGMYFMVSSWCSVAPLHKNKMVLAFLFFPSVVFWSSGIIKESIAMGCLGFSLGFLMRYLYGRHKPAVFLVLSVVFMAALWQLKYYVAAVWIIVLVPFAMSFIPYFQKKNFWLILSLIAGMAILVTFTHPNFYLHRIVEVVYNNYEAYHQLSGSGGAMTYPYNEQSVWFFILNAPIALFTALFLPLIPHTFSLPVILASVENWIILILFAGWVANKILLKKFPGKVELMLLVYIAILAIFLGLSVPNFGTLARFRVSFMPFFVWLILVDNYFLLKFKIDLERLNVWTRNL